MIKKWLGVLILSLVSMQTASAFMGPYVGADGSITNNTSSRSNFRGLTGSVMGGFGGMINDDIYLSGELFADIGTILLDSNTGCGTDVRSTYGYGLSLLPGIMLSNRTMTYLRVGLLKERFPNMASTITGGQLGLGLQTSITQVWDLRFEYDYVAYQRTQRVSAASDQFKLGFIYKFG